MLDPILPLPSDLAPSWTTSNSHNLGRVTIAHIAVTKAKVTLCHSLDQKFSTCFQSPFPTPTPGLLPPQSRSGLHNEPTSFLRYQKQLPFAKMVGLLDLPLELREPILLDVILDTTQPPPDGHASVQNREGYENIGSSGISHDPWGRMVCKPLQHHAMPLLHVNQQIRDEVINLMPRRLAHKFNDAKVDVLYVENMGWDIQATWLSAPFPTKTLDTLHATVRDLLFRTPISPVLGHPKVSTTQDCRYWLHPETAVMFLQFLAVFSREQKGTTTRYTDAYSCWSKAANRTIRNVVIDIPFELDQQASLETRLRCFGCVHDGVRTTNVQSLSMIPSGKRAALILAQSLQNQLLRLLEMVQTGWSFYEFPRIAYESIGAIHLKVGGRPFASFDLGQILAKMPRNEEWTAARFSRSGFFEWKRNAEEKRRTAGFGEVRPSFQEHELAGSAGIIASMLSARCDSLVSEATSSTEDVAPPIDAPEAEELIAFTGNAVFVQDGVALPGNATFYCPDDTVGRYSGYLQPGAFQSPNDPYEGKYIEEQAKDGELVLFKGEAILFSVKGVEFSITSGEATFYGPAEIDTTEQCGVVDAGSQQEKKSR